jgi:hypothetical protein
MTSQEAFTIFELWPPINILVAKKKFKMLVKQSHPDMQSGSKDQFIRVKEAWNLIQVVCKDTAPPENHKKTQKPKTATKHKPAPNNINTDTTEVRSDGYQTVYRGNLIRTVNQNQKLVLLLEVDLNSNGNSIRDITYTDRDTFHSQEFKNHFVDKILPLVNTHFGIWARLHKLPKIVRNFLLESGFEPHLFMDNPPALTYLHKPNF